MAFVLSWTGSCSDVSNLPENGNLDAIRNNLFSTGQRIVVQSTNRLLRALLLNIKDGREGSYELLSDYLEERGGSYRLTGEERWEAVWLWQNRYVSYLYLEPEPIHKRSMLPPSLTWEDIMNVEGFEVQACARADKLLLAEWWGEQQVACASCRGRLPIVLKDQEKEIGVIRLGCFACQNTGINNDTRRQGGMRWLVAEGKQPRAGVDSIEWMQGKKPYTELSNPECQLPEGLSIFKNCPFPNLHTRFNAYYEAAQAVGEWLENKHLHRPKFPAPVHDPESR